MFIWDFVAETILDQVLDWVYAQIIGFLGSFDGALYAHAFQLALCLANACRTSF